MAQLFPKGANSFSRTSLVLAGLAAAAVGLVAALIARGSFWSGQSLIHEQPVHFSHLHHVKGLGIDCRYCHTGVEESSFAGIPSTKTCMTCHSQIWTNAEALEPVRQAYKTGRPLPWNRVHVLPDYVYFNHSIHVAKGVACATCHGPVNEMPLVFQQNTLFMTWCLDCHRHPERSIGPREAVYQPSDGRPNAGADGQELVKRYHIKSAQKLADCYTCHR